MKKLTTLFVTALITVGVFCQIPQKMSYQAVIRDADGELVKNNSVGMQISILGDSINGTPVFVETLTATTNTNGLVTLEIGGGTPVSGTFAGIDWSTGVYFLKTETDPGGGTNYSINGTSQLLSVPYALYAKNCDDLMKRIEALEQAVFTARDGFFTMKVNTDELYFIDMEDNSITMIGNIGLTIEHGFFGMQYIDHKLYLCLGGNLYSYDLSSGTLTQILHNDHLAWQFSINSLGEIYSVNEVSEMPPGSTYKIDIESNTATLLGTTGTPSIWGMGFDSEDQLWAVDEFYGTYGTINTTTGRFTQYSSATGFPGLYQVTTDNNGNLYSLHGGTGLANGIIKYNISTDEASLMIPLEQGVWVGLAYGSWVTSKISEEGRSIVDYDGNVYDTIQIGDQTWMAENLRTTKYNDGSDIPNITDNTAWTELSTGAYCWYNNDNNNQNPYGAYYNFYAIADNRNICPSGWHVPSIEEWTILSDFLGGNTVSGGKLKEIGLAHWNSPNTDATNETGFTAIAGGARQESGAFNFMGMYGYYWTSSEFNSLNAHLVAMSYAVGTIAPDDLPKIIGFPVRCIKD